MTGRKLRIAFMGTPDFALPVLDTIRRNGHEIACVYTQPPRPKGRGGALAKSPVHEWADAKGIAVRTPENFKNPEDIGAFRALELDAAVVAAYGMLLPQDILDAPKHGCINIHPSLLPRWRGPSPVQFAILKGDQKTGVSIMSLVRKMDAGPVIAVRETEILPRETYAELNLRLWALGTEMIAETLDRLAEEGALNAVPQAEDGVTFSKIFEKADGRIDWTQDAARIDRRIRALNPWPGVWTESGGKRIKILEAVLSGPGETGPGMILDASGRVACGNGTSIRLLKIQPEGKKPMDFTSALNGGYPKIGERFS